jgi:hypothetical protein
MTHGHVPYIPMQALASPYIPGQTATERYARGVTDRSVHRGATPIEVHLANKRIGIACTVVHDDESTETLDLVTLYMHGAKIEATNRLHGLGYEPVGRWSGGVRVFRHVGD